MLNYNSSGINVFNNDKLAPTYNGNTDRYSKAVGQWTQPLLTDYNEKCGSNKTCNENQFWPTVSSGNINYHYQKSSPQSTNNPFLSTVCTVSNQLSSHGFNRGWPIGSSGNEFDLLLKPSSSIGSFATSEHSSETIPNSTKSVLSFSNQISQLLRYKSYQALPLEEAQNVMIKKTKEFEMPTIGFDDNLKSKVNVLDENLRSNCSNFQDPIITTDQTLLKSSKVNGQFSFEKCNNIYRNNEKMSVTIEPIRQDNIPFATSNQTQNYLHYYPTNSWQPSYENRYIDHQQLADQQRCNSIANRNRRNNISYSDTSKTLTESIKTLGPDVAFHQTPHHTFHVKSNATNLSTTTKLSNVSNEPYRFASSQGYYTDQVASNIYHNNSDDTFKQHQQVTHSVLVKDQYDRKKKTVVEQIAERVIKRLVRLVCEEVDESTFRQSVAISTEDDIDMEFARCCALFAKWAPYFKNNNV